VPRIRGIRADARSHPMQGAPVLDVVFIAAAIVLVAIVALIGRGVEKL
jgi:hypothetical protein